MNTAPDFAILGAGAIGSILGAHLARAGHSVVMLVRERRAQQLRSSGLRIRGLAEFDIDVPVLTDASQLRQIGTLIVAMKTMGTAEALQPLRAAQIDATFSIQNGVFKNDHLIAAFGREHVLGSLADTSGELLPSGEVLFTRNINLLVGELDGHLSERAQSIASTIDRAGVRSTAVDDMLGREWSKFVAWTGFMTLAVATRAVTWKYLVDPDIAILLARTVREMGVLARAEGIALNDQAMLPVASMCRGSEQEAIEVVLRAGESFRTKAPDHRMSALQDFSSGRPLEIEDTVGEALRVAARHGLAMPVQESLYRLVRGLERLGA
ncbi:MAG TPA: ketopantoate reductase family protein [Povalibacter sp.]|uniref:ketopantoate reductase family protein n=1 Tax=Povalibacter sp. TaxID=1962978 RepID=UPI002C1A37A5|nr:ketopantoate reductase family protein [Povalibacter sp.]HMN43869.1 ketopantoate reductase family protein [Povalibacter sp.]